VIATKIAGWQDSSDIWAQFYFPQSTCVKGEILVSGVAQKVSEATTQQLFRARNKKRADLSCTFALRLSNVFAIIEIIEAVDSDLKTLETVPVAYDPHIISLNFEQPKFSKSCLCPHSMATVVEPGALQLLKTAGSVDQAVALRIIDLQEANGKLKCNFSDGKENMPGVITSQVHKKTQALSILDFDHAPTTLAPSVTACPLVFNTNFFCFFLFKTRYLASLALH
jgi:hypothetical protein